MAIPVFVTTPFAHDAEGRRQKKDFSRLFASRVADTAEDGHIAGAFYDGMAFYPLDPQDRDADSDKDEDPELIKKRLEEIDGTPIALPIEHNFSPHELLCLIQQELDWVIDMDGGDRRRDSEDSLDWDSRVAVRPRRKAASPRDEAPDEYRGRDAEEWDWYSYRFVVVADTTELYCGVSTTAIFFCCDYYDLRQRICGRPSEHGDDVQCQHRFAAHFLGESPEWCRDRAIGAVRLDVRNLYVMMTTIEDSSLSLEDSADRVYHDTGVDGVYVDMHYQRRLLEHAAASLDLRAA